MHEEEPQDWYNALLMHNLMISHLKKSIIANWNSIQDSPLIIALLQEWKPLVNQELFESSILLQLILPRLKQLISTGSILELSSFSSWFLGFFPLFGEELCVSFLEPLLCEWILPAISSAPSQKEIVLLKQSLSEGTFSFFMHQYIHPSMLQRTDFDEWLVLSQRIGLKFMENVWIQGFFPWFFAKLADLEPEKNQAIDFYLNWRKRLGDEFVQSALIRRYFVVALHMLQEKISA